MNAFRFLLLQLRNAMVIALGVAGQAGWLVIVPCIAHAGSTWSEALYLNPGNETNYVQNSRVCLESDGSRTCVAAWMNVPRLYSSQINVSRSENAGDSWTKVATLNVEGSTGIYGREDEDPCVKTDGHGTWIIAWHGVNSILGANSGDKDIYGVEHDIFFSRSVDDGLTWSTPALLNSDGMGDVGADQDIAVELAADGQGHWIAVWLVGRPHPYLEPWDLQIKAARSLDDGATWLPTFILNPLVPDAVYEDLYPSIDTDGQGTWLCLWNTRNTLGRPIPAGSRLVTSTSTDLGATWSAPKFVDEETTLTTEYSVDPKPLSDRSRTWVHPKLLCDRNGTWIATCDTNLRVSPTSIYYSIPVWRSTDAGDSWSSASIVREDAGNVCAKGWPRLATDRAGKWLVTWYDQVRPATYSGNSNFYFIMTSNSVDGGLNWCPPEFTGGVGIYPDVEYAGAGKWIAAWQLLNNSMLPDTIIPNPAKNDLKSAIGSDLTACPTADSWADLVVSKVHDRAEVFVGDALTWTVNVENRGPARATEIALTDTMPDGVQVVSHSCDKAQCAQSGLVVTCPIDGLAGGERARLTIVAKSSVTGSLRNVADAFGKETDTNIENNRAEDCVLVRARPQAQADLRVAITVQPDTVRVGEWVWIGATVKNPGPSASELVTLVNTLPTGAVVGSITSSHGSCRESGQDVSCDLGTVGPGTEASIWISATMSQTGLFSDTATVSSLTPDRDLSNNTARARVIVNPPAASGPDLTGYWSSLSQSWQRKNGKPYYARKRGKAGVVRIPANVTAKLDGVFDVWNIGDAHADNSVLRFYLSADQVFDSGDSLLMQLHDVGNLAAGDTKSRQLHVNLPKGITATGMYVIAVVDSDNDVAESNEANNEIASETVP